jgi:putative transposase
MRLAQMEVGKVWTDIVGLHRQARADQNKWPNRDILQKHTKGRYALHSQSVQMICHQLIANVDATIERRRNEPGSRTWLRFPYKEKNYFPVYWPAQAVSYSAVTNRLILPMGRGRKSLSFRLDLGYIPGGVKLVWNEGYELHIVRADLAAAPEKPGQNHGTVDLGEIHQAAVVSNTGKSIVVSGRGIRGHKRLLSKQLGEIARKRSHCTKGSRQSRKLQTARQKRSLLSSRRIRDLRHKGTRKVIQFCQAEGIGHLFVGDPRGVRQKDSGRKHNQRMAGWEMGKDISYLKHKSKLARIECFTGDERGTSSRCPECDHRQKVKGRVWQCKACPFIGPRDVVGGMNMHPLAFQTKVTLPAKVTYLRPGPERAARGINNPKPVQAQGRSSRAVTRQREARLPLPPLLLGRPPPSGIASCRPQALETTARSAPRRHKTQPRTVRETKKLIPFRG